MLCGIGLRFNLLGGDVFGRVSDKGSSEDREQPVGFQTAEALGRFHHACRRPAERPGGISPSLHIATDATPRPPSEPHFSETTGSGKDSKGPTESKRHNESSSCAKLGIHIPE